MNWSVLGGVQQVLLNSYDSMKQGVGVWGNIFLLEWVDATLSPLPNANRFRLYRLCRTIRLILEIEEYKTRRPLPASTCIRG